MPRFLQPLLLLLARLADRQLAVVVQYLKVENEILRARLPQRVTVTPEMEPCCICQGCRIIRVDSIQVYIPARESNWVHLEQSPDGWPEDPVPVVVCR